MRVITKYSIHWALKEEYANFKSYLINNNNREYI